jgi:hypothetical protein
VDFAALCTAREAQQTARSLTKGANGPFHSADCGNDVADAFPAGSRIATFFVSHFLNLGVEWLYPYWPGRRSFLRVIQMDSCREF